MTLSTNFKMMAVYNQRMNAQLLTSCFQLDADKLNEETGSFFPSIIDYWNHILFGDLILLTWLAKNDIASLRLTQLVSYPTPYSPKDKYCSNLAEIKSLRLRVDETIIELCANLTDEDCEIVMNYTSTEGYPVSKKAGDVIQHLFNHQTHHRGQLTCLLSQAGIDYGCTDLPFIVSEGSD